MPLDLMVLPIRSGRPSRARLRRTVGVALAAVLAVGLSACSADPFADAYTTTDNTGYVADSDFDAVKEFAMADRGEPVVFGGITEDGEDFTSADSLGDVTVVNFWYASCGPCRAEAKDLEAVWQEFQDEDVSFIGVNIYDQADTAKAFAEQYGVTYPSLIDVNTGEAKLAFATVTPIQAPPTTLVLDREGRITARILGQIDGTSILSTLVKDALAESK